MSVTWTRPAAVAAIGVLIRAGHARRPEVLRVWHQLGDRLATDPERAGEPWRDGYRFIRVGPVVAIYTPDDTGTAVVRHAAWVAQRPAGG